MSDSHWPVALRAAELLPDDVKVLGYCIRTWHYHLTPSRKPAADPSASHAAIRPRIDRALAALERILAASDGEDTADLRVAAFWVHHIRAHDHLVEEPIAEAIADVHRRLDTMLAILQKPQLDEDPRRVVLVSTVNTL